MCWLIPFLTGLLTALLTCCYCKRKTRYECQVEIDKIQAEKARLTTELETARAKNLSASASTSAETNVYNSAAFDDGMKKLIKIEADAKATTVTEVEMAPAQSLELAKLKTDVKTKHVDVANFQKTSNVAAVSGLAATAFVATNVSSSDFLTKVVGTDAQRIKKEAEVIAQEEAELTKLRTDQAQIVATTLDGKRNDDVSSDSAYQSATHEADSNHNTDEKAGTDSELLVDFFGSNPDTDDRENEVESDGSSVNEAALAVVASSKDKKNPVENKQANKALSADHETESNAHTSSQRQSGDIESNSSTMRKRFLTADSFDKKVARKAMGKTIKFNDLTVVEGIGPKIAGLFHDAGIATWRKLSETSVSRCQKILDDAGSRYRVHKPDTWPDQAKLAAKGEWEVLAQLQDELDGGRKA